MQGILVDPTARTIRAVNLRGWDEIATVIGCRTPGRIQFIGQNNDVHRDGVDVWVDDDGLSECTAETRFWSLSSLPWPLAGRGLLLGITPGGETVGTWVDPEILSEFTRWIGGPADLEAAIQARAFDRPETSITSVGSDGRRTRSVFWTWRWPRPEAPATDF